MCIRDRSSRGRGGGGAEHIVGDVTNDSELLVSAIGTIINAKRVIPGDVGLMQGCT